MGSARARTDQSDSCSSVRSHFTKACTICWQLGGSYVCRWALQCWKLFGDITLPRKVLRRCPETVHFAGRLSPEHVLARYRQADALVFPTLCDGFGMVVTEAFSQGLPVITTPRAGAADLVREGINGFVVPAADPEALARALDWCLSHRADLHAMRVEARATAAGWQWSDYRRRLINELLSLPLVFGGQAAMTGQRRLNSVTMLAPPAIPALFVSARNALSPASGGVQICTREYMEVIRGVGFELTVIPYDTDRRLFARLRRRLRPRPYSDLLPIGLASTVADTRRNTTSRFVFLNLVSLAPLALPLRKQIGRDEAQIVLLSHGLESVDYLHEIRAPQTAAAANALKLGRQLFAEAAQRRAIDHVICLAPFEVEIERWLGARRVDWLPRIVPAQPLDWQPDPSRLGCVSTVNHAPNVEGLTLFLQEFERLAPAGVRFRLVGGPAREGCALAARFPHVDYLGPLDETALTVEAATWSCFVHPLFCYARGCSTKLAAALGWHLPVVTTPAGMRGYTWREGIVPSAEDPRGLAELALRTLEPAAARAAREQSCLAARSAPTLPEVTARLREILLPITANSVSNP